MIEAEGGIDANDVADDAVPVATTEEAELDKVAEVVSVVDESMQEDMEVAELDVTSTAAVESTGTSITSSMAISSGSTAAPPSGEADVDSESPSADSAGSESTSPWS